jgi:hypothetical protein
VVQRLLQKVMLLYLAPSHILAKLQQQLALLLLGVMTLEMQATAALLRERRLQLHLLHQQRHQQL